MGLLRFIRTTLSLDLRSLALYRFLMGLIIMADVVYRWPDLLDFYTDVGLVPRALFTGEMSMPWSFSLHLANGSLNFITIMFAIQFVLGLMVCLGYKTPWAMFFSYVLNVSVHNRDWLVNNGGDDILRAILFISIFLPLNKCFSLDSALTEKTEEKPQEAHFSTWGLTFLLQAFVIYFVSFILKDHNIWRKDFTGIFYASRLDIFTTPLGFWLREFPLFQKLSTIFTIYLECLGPLLLVFCAVLGRFWWIGRTLVVFLFWILHIGIIFSMWIGVFPYTCIVMWCLFLPAPFWDKIFAVLQHRFEKLTLYFDEECHFCKKAVLILREFFLFSDTKTLPAQKYPDIYAQMKKNNSWVITNSKNEKFFKFDAFVTLIKSSPLLCFLAPVFARNPIHKIGSMIYHWVSNHRGEVAKISQFFPIKPARKRIATLSFIYQLAGAFLFMTLFMWNVTTIKVWGIQSPFFQNVARYLHLYQEWNMFAPFPKLDNVWIEVNGKLSDGTDIELLTGIKDVYTIKSEEFYKQIANEHWRKFYLNMSERTDYARYYGGFMCRKWNDRRVRLVENTTLRKLDIVVFSQSNLPDGSRGGINRKMSWTHWCFDEDYKRESRGAQ